MNARQRKFAHEYVKNQFNGVLAVHAAGYNQGYNAACVTASRLLRKAKIRSMVEATIEKANNEAELTAERVSKEIAKVAFTDAPVDSAAKMKGLDLATKVLGMQVQKIETANTTPDNSLVFLSRRIAKLAQKSSKSLQSVELELQSELADRSDEDYSAELDARVHPECWPSGNLLDAEPVIQAGDQ